MLRLFKFMIKYSPKLLAVALVSALVVGIGNTVLIGMINMAMPMMGNVNPPFMAGFFAMAVIFPVILAVSQYLINLLGQNGIFDLRMRLSRDLLNAPLRELESHGSNKILAALCEDITQIGQALTFVPVIGTNLAIVLSCFGYLVWLFWPAAVGVIILTIITLLAYMAIQKGAQALFKKGRDERDVLYKHFGALTNGTKELKLHQDRRREWFESLLAPTMDTMRKALIRGHINFVGAAAISRVAVFGGMGAYVFFLPRFFPDISFEVVSGYIIVMLYIFAPMNVLTAMVPFLGQAAIALRKVEGFTTSFEMATKNQIDACEPMTAFKTLEFRGITHEYGSDNSDDTFTLGPVNLEFKPGEIVFLVGGNGSGKTTLAKMMAGLYNPEKGRILVDNQEVNEGNAESYRQLFSALFVDFYLFDNMLGLAGDNIDEKATEYLKQLHLDRKVKVKDGQLSTLELSQGQRKRLALLTAYLEDRPIYLFDEWAADQDPTFKEVFYNVLLPDLKRRGKTCFVISHDDKYFNVGDRLIKLDYGQVVSDQITTDI